MNLVRPHRDQNTKIDDLYRDRCQRELTDVLHRIAKFAFKSEAPGVIKAQLFKAERGLRKAGNVLRPLNPHLHQKLKTETAISEIERIKNESQQLGQRINWISRWDAAF
jgi:hypothetical protein